MRRVRSGFSAVTLLLVFIATAGAETGRFIPVPSKPNAEVGRSNLETSEARAEASPDEQGEVTWLRDGCELLVNGSDSESETVDYWSAVCHGYVIAARDYSQLVTGLFQKLEGNPLAVCIESDEVTGRDVARVFVEYVDKNPESRNKAAAIAMLSAVTERWCSGFESRGS